MRGFLGYNYLSFFTLDLAYTELVLGTTIPAGTAIMTGTCAGVGAFMKPKTFLANGDIIEVEISNIGVLRNKIVFT